jgi:hypothetical protein
MAIHAVITGAPSRVPYAPQIDLSRATRRSVADEIERLIALLDFFDGDPDLEPETDFCTAGDDGCGQFVINGRSAWGSTYAEEPEWAPRTIREA